VAGEAATGIESVVVTRFIDGGGNDEPGRNEMRAKPRTIKIFLSIAGWLAAGFILAGCGPTNRVFTPDFEAVHSPVNDDANTYLIFGKIPVSPAAQGLSPELAAFLGRWEGYDYGPPVKKDYKIVLAIQNISAQGGTAFLWMGTNLQYPFSVQEIHFQVKPGAAPVIEFNATYGNATQTIRLAYASDKKLLVSPDAAHRPLELSRAQTFFVYKDYSRYLGSKRIYTKEYQDTGLPQYGKGYMLYLPEGYEDNPDKTWPLIFFLHGNGDRGDNIHLLAKASPFMMIREKGPLPFIIIAPLLSASRKEFPLKYMEGVLAEAQAAYRVDPKRIYVTGLSLGGKAAYRFAVQHPDTFAALAALSAYADPETLPKLGRIKDLPVWAIHGIDDTIVPLALDQKTVHALNAAGGNVTFTVLGGHDHDTWSDTYSDPSFYNWLLQYRRP
jgi:predicted peptidase